LVSGRVLTGFGARLLAGRGVPPANARYVAESAVLNEAAGVTTHGVVQFFYFDKQVGPVIDPSAEPKLVLDRSAVALVDGNGSFAQLAMRLAARIAAGKARRFGIGLVCVRNTSWLAGLGVKLLPLVRQGFFAELWAGSAFKYVAPFGGCEARLGTNPIAFGFPVPGRPPVICDFSTSTVARGRAGLMIHAGDRAPEKIFLDGRGRATDNSAVLEAGGSIMLLGGEHYGYKGFGLSLWVEALGLMAGNRYEPGRELRESFALMLINPAAFGEADFYSKEVNRFVEIIKGGRRRPGVKEIRLPGERSFRSLARSEGLGIFLSGETLARLNDLAARNGLKPISLKS